MQEIYSLSIGAIIIILGIPIGNLLAKATKEELSKGKKWFKLLIVLSLLGGIIALIFRNDAIMFGLFFTAVVTSRSLKSK
jgi:hypothetical protein